jgi:hypothetical protein
MQAKGKIVRKSLSFVVKAKAGEVATVLVAPDYPFRFIKAYLEDDSLTITLIRIGCEIVYSVEVVNGLVYIYKCDNPYVMLPSLPCQIVVENYSEEDKRTSVTVDGEAIEYEL